MSDRLAEIRARAPSVGYWADDSRWLCDEVERLRDQHQSCSYFELEAERDAAIQRAEQAEAHMYVLNGCVADEREKTRKAEALLAEHVRPENATSAQLFDWAAKHPAEMWSQYQQQENEATRLEAENAKLLAVVEAARPPCGCVPNLRAEHMYGCPVEAALAALAAPGASGAKP